MQATIKKRLLCLLYEILILFALGMLAGLPFVYLTNYPQHPELRPWYRGYLFVIFALYFVYQWQSSGQTVPMKTWRLKIVDEINLTPPTPMHALRRYVFATCCMLSGLSFLWLMFDKQHRWLHDKLSGTRTIQTVD